MGKGIHRPELYCAWVAFGVMDLMEALFTKQKRRIRFTYAQPHRQTHNPVPASEMQRPLSRKTVAQKISPPDSDVFCAAGADILVRSGLPLQTDEQRLSAIVAQVIETPEPVHNRQNRDPNWRERFRRDWQ